MAFTPLAARREMLRDVRANETSRAGFGDEKTFATVKEMKLACFRVETSNRTMMDEALESLKEVSGVPFVQPPAALGVGGLSTHLTRTGIAGPTGPVEELEASDWDRTMAVNVRSAFLCCRRSVPLLHEAGGGSILLTASTAGITGYPMRSPYAASKYAVVGLGKTLAMEVGELGIRVNVICPGSVDGERIDRVNFDIDFPWPIAADGVGSSMELINPSLDNNLGSSWRSSTTRSGRCLPGASKRARSAASGSRSTRSLRPFS